MGVRDEAPHVEVRSRADWRAWLQQNHAIARGAWLVTWKKNSKGPHVPYAETVEEALCFGWVDSTSGSVDEFRAKLWFAPRRRGSGWSAPNKERIERLSAAGLIAPAGQAVIDAAKADGSWTLLDASEALEEPADLIRAFRAVPGSRGHWKKFPPGVRKQILQWITTAKRPETRARRVEETARLAGENIRANQWRAAP